MGRKGDLLVFAEYFEGIPFDAFVKARTRPLFGAIRRSALRGRLRIGGACHGPVQKMVWSDLEGVVGAGLAAGLGTVLALRSNP